MRNIDEILNAAEYKELRLDEITPAPYNPRVDLAPSDPEYKTIKASIQDHGLIQPIVVNKRTGNAVGGNQRLAILRGMGIESATCAIVDVSLKDEMQMSVALNKIGNLWDREKLREVMLELKAAGYDATKTGFDQYDLDALTQEMNVAVAGFFEDNQDDRKPKKTRLYRCPHCGEVFEK